MSIGSVGETTPAARTTGMASNGKVMAEFLLCHGHSGLFTAHIGPTQRQHPEGPMAPGAGGVAAMPGSLSTGLI